MRPTLGSVNFRIRSASLEFFVDVRLHDFDGRWLAVADISSDHEIGLGRRGREACQLLQLAYDPDQLWIVQKSGRGGLTQRQQ